MKLYLNHTTGFLLTVCALAGSVAANADKIIFTAPEPVTYPLASPSLADLNLDVIGPENLSLRTHLSRVFRDDDFDPEQPERPRGLASWFILDSLTPSQRYELRVCWAAIEPTEFTMDVYELDHVWETPDLMMSLYNYSSTRQSNTPSQATPQIHRPSSSSSGAKERTASLLLLQVHAAADYVSHDAALMRRPPPPVLVDLILDPYLLNAVPESLLLTGIYVVLVAVGTFYLARWIADRMTAIAGTEEAAALKKKE